MPSKKKPSRITVSQALKALRRSGKSKESDVVMVVRGRINREGQWEVDWEAAHWLPNLDDSMIAPSGLPSGFGVAAAKEVASITAGDTAEESLGRFGAALGKGLFDAIGDKLGGVMKDEE